MFSTAQVKVGHCLIGKNLYNKTVIDFNFGIHEELSTLISDIYEDLSTLNSDIYFLGKKKSSCLPH